MYISVSTYTQLLCPGLLGTQQTSPSTDQGSSNPSTVSMLQYPPLVGNKNPRHTATSWHLLRLHGSKETGVIEEPSVEYCIPTFLTALTLTGSTALWEEWTIGAQEEKAVIFTAVNLCPRNFSMAPWKSKAKLTWCPILRSNSQCYCSWTQAKVEQGRWVLKYYLSFSSWVSLLSTYLTHVCRGNNLFLLPCIYLLKKISSIVFP